MTEERTFTQMLAVARGYHPEAVPYLTYDRKWTIRIPTDLTESYDLEPEFDDTPAGEISKDNSFGENQLERWARKNGYGDEPLAIVARRYNQLQTNHAEHRAAMTTALAEAGFPVEDKIDFSAMDEETFKRYEAINQNTWDALATRRVHAEQEINHLAYGA